jgi:beta-glucosidase
MKKFRLHTAWLILLVLSCTSKEVEETFTLSISEERAIVIADSIINLMTIDEKLQIIKGHNSFYIKGFEKYGIPELYLSDASQGVHIREKFAGFHLGEQLEKSTAFPCPIQLAATWNPDLSKEYAKSIGEECRAGGIAVLLGPGTCNCRISQCGRNFEYFGEDPYLASRMVEKYVLGMQSTGTISTLKHFIANNTEYRRRASNSIVSERALHEIYMPPFKAGIDAGAMAVMTAYNKVNGEWAGESDFVINNLLRKQLGFKWLVMTDWWSVENAKKVVESGQNLEMPDGESMHNIKELLESGEIKEVQIDRMVRGILKTIVAMDLLNKPAKDESYLETFPKHVDVALQTAREGIVLLKNDNSILPLGQNNDKKILLTGKYINQLAVGGGSANVKGYDHVFLKDALTEKFKNLYYSEDPTENEMKSADVVIVSVGTNDSEGRDRNFALPQGQEDLVKQVVKNNKNTIVIVNSGGGIRMTDWNNDAAAIVYNWFGGQVGNKALAEILTGETNPSGKLPMTIEKDFKDSPGYGYISEDVVFANDWRLDPRIHNINGKFEHVYYNEGVLVGYRWYDTKKIETLYPFGHGLSYTTFESDNLHLSASEINAGESVDVTFEVANTGKIDGAVTMQIYVADKQTSVVRPVKELKGFKKVTLSAGQKEQVTIILDKSAFAYWDEITRDWKVEPGEFEILLAHSAKDIKASVKMIVR